MQQFNEMKEILSHEEAPLDRLGDNHIMRFMQSLLWDTNQALDYLRRAEEARKEFHCDILYEHEFTHIID